MKSKCELVPVPTCESACLVKAGRMGRNKTKVIHRSIGAFGGSSFRAIERGDRVVIQESVQGARWKDRAVASVGEFYALADRADLFNPYKQDAGALWRITGAIVRGEDLGCWYRKE